MSIFDYDNVSKYLAWYSRLPRWLKVILPITLALIIFLYMKFVPVRKLENENDGLTSSLTETKSELSKVESELSRAESEISNLRDRKDELHRENLHLKEINDAIQKTAEQLHPELDTVTAIAKLAEDLEIVRSLATRDVFKPLVAQKKKELISKLKELLARHNSFSHTVTICCEQGNSSRAKIARDLRQYLEEAGFKVTSVSRTTYFSGGGVPPNISIKIHPDDKEFAQKFINVVSPLYIDEIFQGSILKKISRGCFEIEIYGDPLFTEQGVVKFR